MMLSIDWIACLVRTFGTAELTKNGSNVCNCAYSPKKRTLCIVGLFDLLCLYSPTNISKSMDKSTQQNMDSIYSLGLRKSYTYQS